MSYRAFFSYARSDDRLANWLHRQLDGFRTPKSIVGSDGDLGSVPAKLHPIFRDRTDLESGGQVTERLQDALEASEALVVLCSPGSAKSKWVNHEIETFLRLGRERRIFPVIAAGEPESGNPETECFPPALRGRGILAADLRQKKSSSGQIIGDGREIGRLKLISGLLGVPLDQLVRREHARHRRLVAALGAAMLSFAGLAAAAVVFGQVAEREKNRANAALEEATISRSQTERHVEAAADAAALYLPAVARLRESPDLAPETARLASVQALIAARLALAESSNQQSLKVAQSHLRDSQNFGDLAARAGASLDPELEARRHVMTGQTSLQLAGLLGQTQTSDFGCAPGRGDPYSLAFAEVSFRNALTVNLRSMDAHIGLGCVLEAGGNVAVASVEYQRALEIDPTNALARSAAARVDAALRQAR